MGSCNLNSSAVSSLTFRFTGSLKKPSLFSRGLRFPGSSGATSAQGLAISDVRSRASVVEKQANTSDEGKQKDDNVAFVAGATGRVGSRTVRELLKLGFRVRACVRAAQRAQGLIESVQQMKLDTGDSQAIDRLAIVECDLEKPDVIVPALGNASVVLCCIGASEKEILDVTGPYRIDYVATKNLIDAATTAKVNHFILVTSLGTNRIGFPAVLLNLFWGVLIWKRKAEEALIASGIPYTIVRPGGMERPTDAYKETHNLCLYEEDTLVGGLVSNLQIAELIAYMAKNCELSCCKVVEAIATTTAPLMSIDKLLEKIPSKMNSQRGSVAAADAPGSTVVTEPNPLSPYPAYGDLKPPASPSPTAPIGATVARSDPIHPQPEPRPLSPYPMYEDMKPPKPPSPPKM